MDKLSTVVRETIDFADIEVALKRIIKNNAEKDLFTIKVGDDKEVAFYNRKTDWNGILGDFWEFVKNYDRDIIVLAHCEDLWRTDDRKELDRVYFSYSILSESIIKAFGGNVCLALEFAEEYLNQ